MSVTQPETEDDPRLAFVYQESLRGLQQQQAAELLLYTQPTLKSTNYR